jgi:hypothetical protein
MPSSKTRIASLLALVGLSGLLDAPTFGRQVPPPDEALAELGILTCSLVGTEDAPGAQSRDMLCRFRPGRRGNEETYAGSVQSIGQARTLYRMGTLMLAVRGPASTKIVPGLLQQTYSAEGSPANAAAAPLIGKTNRAIILQPLLEEGGRVAAGKTRPDATIITVELRLKSSPA